VYCIHL